MAEHSQFSLFRTARFMPFFITQALGALNDNIFKNALIALVHFQGSQMAGLNTNQVVNLSALIFILPFFLFSALFGQFADKYEKSMQIRRIKLFEVFIMVTATVGFWIDSLPLQLGVLFLLVASPVAAASFVMVVAARGDGVLAANIVVLTTLLSIVTVTLGFFLLSMFSLVGQP